MRRFPLTLAATFIVSTAAVAADNKAPGEEDLMGRIDLAVPDIPAVAVLGLSPDTIIRPSTAKDLAVSLINGIGQDGKLQAGIALDVRPALYVASEYFSLANYRDESKKTLDAGTPFERYKMKKSAYWTKLRLSFATGRSESGQDRNADRYAIGASFNLFDHGDSRLSPMYRQCVGSVLKSLGDALEAAEISGTPLSESDREQLLSNNRPKIKKCAKAFEDSHWNADSWDVGAAYFDFNTKEVQSTGYAAWTTYARHLGSEGQLILHARVSNDEVALDPKDKTKFVVQDSQIVGARIRWKAPGGSFLVEATRRRVDRENAADDNYTLASIGYEIRISEGLWLQMATGKAYGTDAFKDDPVFSGQFRWGRTKKSLLED